jgi:hypothetical protein
MEPARGSWVSKVSKCKSQGGPRGLAAIGKHCACAPDQRPRLRRQAAENSLPEPAAAKKPAAPKKPAPSPAFEPAPAAPALEPSPAPEPADPEPADPEPSPSSAPEPANLSTAPAGNHAALLAGFEKLASQQRASALIIHS